VANMADTRCLGATLKERDRLEDLVVDGTIPLKLACRMDIIFVQYLFDIILKTRCQFNLLNTREKFPSGTLMPATKNFCVLHNEVEHNYISSSITLGLQLHVSALYVGHLQVVI